MKLELHNMKRLLLSVVLGVAGLPLASRATDAFFINTGTIDGAITPPPQIDAINFVNEPGGAMINFYSGNIFEPYDTSNTQNYTNKGTISAIIGWRFDTAPSGNGSRSMARSFRNHTSGRISTVDGGFVQHPLGFQIPLPSTLLISATNLINEGYLTVDELGLMKLDGKSVALNRGGIQVQPLFGQGTAEDVAVTIFSPDTGIYDNYWNLFTNNINLNQNPILIVQGPNVAAVSPPHAVQLPGGVGLGGNVVIANPATSFVYTNADFPVTIITTNDVGTPVINRISTNMTVQAAFVGLSNPNFNVDARFFPSTITTNLFSTITVGVTTTLPNPVTGGSDSLSLYLLDRLASETNRNLVANIAPVSPPTFRPACYQVWRTQPLEYALGSGPNNIVRPNLLYDPQTMTNIVGAVQGAYSATADFVATRQPFVPGASLTNVPGRIEINADNLDLTRSRFRADGLVSLKTTNLVSSSDTIMDAFNLFFDLGSSNGTLRIQNLALPSVSRFGGDLRCWSGVWTNTMRFELTNFTAIITNDPGDTNEPPIPITVYVREDITNSITIGFHALIVDATALVSQVPVITHDLATRGNAINVFLNDPLTIGNTFVTEAQRFSIAPNGTLVLQRRFLPDGTVLNENFTSVNAPNLLFLTNNGTLVVPNEAHFGDDRLIPYGAFVNGGSFSAAGTDVRTAYFENTGSMDIRGSLQVQSVSNKLELGESFITGDLKIAAWDLKLRDYFNLNQGATVFTITNSLSDSGPSAGVQLLCNDGFHVTFANSTGKPQAGDLSGTMIDTAIPIFASIPHTWPGDDRGVSTSGFINNLALGGLRINFGFSSEAVFNGAGESNAMYVDFLEFVNVTLEELDSALSISPNMVIYFADSNLSAEALDGRAGGRLRWVSSFAGPNSSVAVVLPGGQVVLMNRALRQSVVIDSDGDGLANAYDPSPLDPSTTALSVSVASVSPLTLALSWNASGQTIYDVEFRTNHNAQWQLLRRHTNSSSGRVTINDQVPPGSPQRYYRVSYSP